MLTKLLICTDLDRTLLPNGKQAESPKAREYFARLVAHPAVTLIYVSGRNLSLIREAISNYRIPVPDWVIGDVGTTMYRVNDSGWYYCDEWEQDIGADWQGLRAKDLQPLFAALSSLRLQEEAKQNRFKLSYYVPLQTDISSLKQEMSRRLSLVSIAASLVYSVDEAECIGLLDVMPSLATKFHAVEFLMQHLGFNEGNTVFAGDSGNDLPVLTSRIPSVLVANADSETLEQAKFQTRQQGTMTSLYMAEGGFLGMNGNYSAGILEGIVHYHPDTLNWMEQNYV